MDTQDYYLITQNAEGEKVPEGFNEWVKGLRGDGYEAAEAFLGSD